MSDVAAAARWGHCSSGRGRSSGAPQRWQKASPGNARASQDEHRDLPAREQSGSGVCTRETPHEQQKVSSGSATVPHLRHSPSRTDPVEKRSRRSPQVLQKTSPGTAVSPQRRQYTLVQSFPRHYDHFVPAHVDCRLRDSIYAFQPRHMPISIPTNTP